MPCYCCSVLQACGAGLSRATEAVQSTPVAPDARASAEPQSAEAMPTLPELLGDIPFTLAPHIMTMQTGLPPIPDFVLPRDLNENMASFCYDFTLENSVLCEPWVPVLYSERGTKHSPTFLSPVSPRPRCSEWVWCLKFPSLVLALELQG